MKVVVFGASGFIGQNVIDGLIANNIDFIATGKRKRNTIFPKPKVDYRTVDILDYDAVCKVLSSTDVVIHLASSPMGDSFRRAKYNMDVNIGGTLNVLEATRKYGCRKIIFASTIQLFDEILYEPVDEKHYCAPKTPYGVSKLACEHYLRVYQQLYGIDYIIFRLCNVYGPHQYPESGALIPRIFDHLINNKELTIYGDGTSKRDYIYVRDVVEFLIQAMKKNNVWNATFNLGTGKSTTILDVIKIASELLAIEPKLVFKPPRANELRNFTVSIQKLIDAFECKPNTTLNSGLMETFKWLESIRR
jgi:UDP-glucose 4-epimerase